MFKIDKEPGLADVLMGTANAKDVVKKIKDNLYVMPAGTKTKNPQKLLESEKMNKLLEEVEGQYDYVLIDSVPSLLLADAEILAAKVDATILVLNAKATKKDEALATKKNFDKIKNARLIGSIFNYASGQKDRYYYYYHYGYHKYY
jgi:capsular exopolysaccharide synthesis family protein